MGWLDMLFGKRAAKHVRAVQKTVRAAQKVTTKPARAEPKPAPIKVAWTKSEKGNDTAEVDGWCVTIFKQDAGWNYCLSEILDAEDIENGDEDDPHFGDGYATKAAARKAALEDI